MERLAESPDKFEQCGELKRLGFRPIILRPRSKAPMHKGYQTREYTDEEWRQLILRDCNVGLLCGVEDEASAGLVVLDVDTDDESKLRWITEEVGDTPMKVRSPRGGTHFYFKARKGVRYGNGVRLRGEPYDLRFSGTHIVCPWSEGEDGTPYVWLGDRLALNELPSMKVSPLRERKHTRRLVEAVLLDGERGQLIRRARAYVACIEPAVAGERGHDRAMRVAGVLVQKFQLTLEEAWPIMVEYSARCVPPWSERELLHKLEDAMKKRK